jgi:hypothetical protein
MPRFRLARPAQLDLADILATSAERWGTEAGSGTLLFSLPRCGKSRTSRTAR